jgi:hypothetical protein
VAIHRPYSRCEWSEKLQENTVDYSSVVDTFSKSGGWKGVIDRDSEEHVRLYRENPKLVGGVKPNGA